MLNIGHTVREGPAPAQVLFGLIGDRVTVVLGHTWIVGPPQNPLAYWHTITIPGLFMLFFVLGWNLLGDAFRDILDPRLRRR